MMNETIRRQLEHRTIRAFTSQAVDDELLRVLEKVAQRAPSSTGMQSWSLIRIEDSILREKLRDLAGQMYMSEVPVLYAFVLDMYRHSRIAAEKQVEFTGYEDYYSYHQAMLDTALAAQNMVVAAESLGLGTVYFGSMTTHAQEVAELLHLPEGTMPVVGLGVGWPAQEPQLKPRLPGEAQVFVDRYQTFADYHQLLADYDAEMREYYDMRDLNRRVDSFTDQTARRYGGMTLAASRNNLELLDRQGFTWQKRVRREKDE